MKLTKQQKTFLEEWVYADKLTDVIEIDFDVEDGRMKKTIASLTHKGLLNVENDEAFNRAFVQLTFEGRDVVFQWL